MTLIDTKETDDMGRHSRRSHLWSRLVSLVLTTLFAGVAVMYLVAPGMWQWSHAEDMVEAKKPRQIDTAEQPVDEALVKRLKHGSDGTEFGPVVLTYHDIGYQVDSKYTVTPEAFALQMRMIHDAGWVTLTSEQVANWTKGAQIPQHSLMITFDDGTKGVWQYADPILKRYNMHAVAFIITSAVGTHWPYYMTWPMIEELSRTGRWDFEAHTHDGHKHIPSDPNGGEQPFMTATEWLAALGRYETPEERHTRVINDLIECKRQLKLHTGRTPYFFAYPFSAHEDDPNDTDKEVQRIVLSLYLIAMLDDAESTRVSSEADLNTGFIRRMDTTVGVSPDRFVEKIVEAATT